MEREALCEREGVVKLAGELSTLAEQLSRVAFELREELGIGGSEREEGRCYEGRKEKRDVTVKDGCGNVYLNDVSYQNLRVLCLSEEAEKELMKNHFCWLKKLIGYSVEELEQFWFISRDTVEEVVEGLAAFGLHLGMKEDDITGYARIVEELLVAHGGSGVDVKGNKEHGG